MFDTLKRAMRGWLRRSGEEQRLSEELEDHLEREAKELRKQGLGEEEAWRTARMRLGGEEQVKEATREERRGFLLETVWQDLKYGSRVLRHSPGFTLVVVLTLALGIGANTAIFSLVNFVLLRPLPFGEPERLVVLHATQKGNVEQPYSVSMPDFLDWVKANQTFERMALFAGWTYNITGREVPERVSGAGVSGEFFPLLGVKPLLGRMPESEEDRPDGPDVLVLSHGLWQRMFGSDPQIVGKTVVVEGRPHTVMGVMPQGFFFPTRETEIWQPIGGNMSGLPRDARFMLCIARLKKSVTQEEAQAEMNVLAAGQEREYPKTNLGFGVRVLGAQESLARTVKEPLLVLLAAVGMVLLIACVNVANLLLARGATRQRETSIRAALGAGKARLVRQLVTENVLLASLGGVAGLVVAEVCLRIFQASYPREMPRLDEVRLDGPMVGFGAALALVVGIVLGIVFALRATRAGVNEDLREGGRTQIGGQKSERMRSVLVGAQVALTLVLLVGGGLLARSFVRLLSVDPGFRTQNILTMNVVMTGPKYRGMPEQRLFVRRTLEAVREVPGVEMAEASNAVPVSESALGVNIVVEGRPETGDSPSALYRAVTGGYFSMFGIPLKRDVGWRSATMRAHRELRW